MNCWRIDTGYEIVDTGDGEDRDKNVGMGNVVDIDDNVVEDLGDGGRNIEGGNVDIDDNVAEELGDCGRNIDGDNVDIDDNVVDELGDGVIELHSRGAGFFS